MTIMKGNTPAKRRRGRSQRKFHSNFKHDDQIKNDDLSMTAAETEHLAYERETPNNC
uniref:Uncharacterized protein n=1 Tax=Arion vulgaris TaxID=1028688 RepID=A0A0B7B3W8_9EUPU